MKKIYTLLFALLCAATMVAQQPNVARNQSVKKAPANAAAFSFSDIQNWTGEGSNVAAMGLKWTGSENTIVFGYRFDGAKTGEDMAIDIVANNPRLFMLMQSGTAYGSAIGGFGWDADNTKKASTISPKAIASTLILVQAKATTGTAVGTKASGATTWLKATPQAI